MGDIIKLSRREVRNLYIATGGLDGHEDIDKEGKKYFKAYKLDGKVIYAIARTRAYLEKIVIDIDNLRKETAKKLLAFAEEEREKESSVIDTEIEKLLNEEIEIQVHKFDVNGLKLRRDDDDKKDNDIPPSIVAWLMSIMIGEIT